MRTFLLSLLGILLFTGLSAQSGMDREEAKAMFEYLQDLRQGKAPKSDPVRKYVKKITNEKAVQELFLMNRFFFQFFFVMLNYWLCFF